MSDLESFKVECESIETIKKEKNDRWEALKQFQDRYGTQYKPIRKFLGICGIGKPKCPNCIEVLVPEIISYDGIYEKSIVHCLKCEYEFAEIWRK